MTHYDFVRDIVAKMKEAGIRKEISYPRQVFHISDDEGNAKDFVIKQTNKTVMYNREDVDAMLRAICESVQDAIKRGDRVTLPGLGMLFPHYRLARATKHPVTGEDIVIAGHYTAKFSPCNELKTCAKVYELSLEDRVGLDTPKHDDEGKTE